MANPGEERLTEQDMRFLADYILPEWHERLAAALGLPGELVTNLRAYYPEDQCGISNKILTRWLIVHREEDNRVVSMAYL